MRAPRMFSPVEVAAAVDAANEVLRARLSVPPDLAWALEHDAAP